ncbi:unnamed protein product [Mytilus edulis]|uniref:Uncharacterized protein n=1 Tax=Mytilus edulis TaxID=6550 RepID=A0A8S3SPG1_MYTED|nr:unnamed protein product [Mytilus edulis]
MISLYIKYGDDILDDDVIKIADLENAASMPLGTAVKSIVFSFIGVFVLELITGVCGMLGVLRHSKTMLSIKYHLYMLKAFIDAAGGGHISYAYNTFTFPNFKRKFFASGFLGMGLTLTGDVMVYDFYIRYIFQKIEVYQYNFYDILVGLAASAVVIGILTLVNAIVGLFGSWRKSSVLIIMINDDMTFQMKLLEDGHYFNDNWNSSTMYWNHMLLTLQCCGVHDQYDTISSTHGRDFCCENAHESIIDIRNTSYPNALNYFGGCGGYKTSINQALEDTLHNNIIRYQYSHASAYYDTYSLDWNTLFIKAQCCGVGTSNVWSMNESNWFASNRDSLFQKIPVQCCKSQTIVYPYARKTDTDCTNLWVTDLYHTQGCDAAAIQNQLEKYSIPFMVFTSIIIVAEICLIVQNAESLIPSRKISNLEQQLVGNDRTIEINCATTSQSNRKHSNENVRSTEQTSNTKIEAPVIKTEGLNLANISSQENLTNSIAFKPTVTLSNETDTKHENLQEQDQKIIDDNNDTKNSRNDNNNQGRHQNGIFGGKLKCIK